MEESERAEWLTHILARGPKPIKQCWHVDLSELDKTTLPLVDENEPEDSPAYDHLLITAEVMDGDSFLTIVPEDARNESSIGIAAKVSEDGRILFFNESMTDTDCDDKGEVEGYTFDGVTRADPSGEKFKPYGEFAEQAERFDSFLDLSRRGKCSLIEGRQ